MKISDKVTQQILHAIHEVLKRNGIEAESAHVMVHGVSPLAFEGLQAKVICSCGRSDSFVLVIGQVDESENRYGEVTYFSKVLTDETEEAENDGIGN